MLTLFKFIIFCITCWFISLPSMGNDIVLKIFAGIIFLNLGKDAWYGWISMIDNGQYIYSTKTSSNIDDWSWHDDGYYGYNNVQTDGKTHIYTTTPSTAYSRRNRSVFPKEDSAKDIFKTMVKPKNVESCELVSDPEQFLPWRKRKVKEVIVPTHTTKTEETTPTTSMQSDKEYMMLENCSTLSETKQKVYDAILEVFNRHTLQATDMYVLLQSIPFIDIYQGTISIYVDNKLFDTQHLNANLINQEAIIGAIKQKLETSLIEINFVDFKTTTLLNYFFEKNGEVICK